MQATSARAILSRAPAVSAIAPAPSQAQHIVHSRHVSHAHHSWWSESQPANGADRVDPTPRHRRHFTPPTR